MRVRYSKKKVN